MGIDVYIDIMVNGLLKVTWGLNRQIDLNGDNGRLLGCIYIYIYNYLGDVPWEPEPSN